MAEITIDTKFLNIGKDEIKIVPVGSLYDAATDLQIDFLKTDDSINKNDKDKNDDGKNENPLLAAFTQEKELKKHCKELLEKIGISKKDWNKINDSITNNDIFRYTSYVIACIKGVDYKNYEDYVNVIEKQRSEAAQEDPKKS